MKKVLISACLLGERVRFDGQSKGSGSEVLGRWLSEGRVVRVCPEVSGGLPVPRPPAEQQADGRVITNAGVDVSAEFKAGAAEALRLVREFGIEVAVMKEGSPSCGSGFVYDGTFSKTRVAGGEGETVRVLRAHGVRVFSEHEWATAAAALE
jgi:uncharacterized protein YbbK (DUF523 family)